MASSRAYDVVFYSPSIGPLLTDGSRSPTGGAETQIHLLTQALADRGWRIAVVVHDAPGLPDRVGRVDVVRQRAVRTRWPVLRSVSYISSVAGPLLELRTDVLVQRAAGTTTGLVGLVARLRRSRFIYSSANVIDFAYDRLEPKRRHVWLYELGVRLASRVIVQTPEQEELCERRFGRRPVVIKSIAEPAVPRSQKPDAFLWVGRLTPYKRPLDFVELARRVPEARFRLLGVPGGDDGRRLEGEIRSASQELANLEVLDPRPRAALAPLIDRAVAMVNTAEYEGMPNVYLESWSRGVPALGLHHDPDGVIAREGVGAFAAGDPERFAELARQLWAGREEQSALAARCLDYIEREHSPEAVVGAWESALGLPARAPVPAAAGVA